MRRVKIPFFLFLALSLLTIYLPITPAIANSKSTLRIAGPYSQETADRFAALYPDFQLEFGDDKWVNSDDLMRAMITEDTRYDVYYISMDWGFDAIKEKRFCADLNSSTVISDFVKSAYPQIQEVLTDGNFIAAFPAMLNLKLMAVNTDLQQSLPEEYNPKDYASYLSLLLHSQELQENKSINVIAGAADRYGLMTELLRQYVLKHEAEGMPLSFDDEAFMKAVELVAKFPEETFMSEEDYDKQAQYPTLFNSASEPLDAAAGEKAEMLMPIPPLSRNDDPVIEANLDMWIINPHSDKIDLAVSFLECVASTMLIRDQMLLCPNLNEPVAEEAFESSRKNAKEEMNDYEKRLKYDTLEPMQKKEIQQKIENLQAFLEDDTYKWTITPNEIAAYRAIAPYMVLPAKSLFLGFDMGSAIESLTEITDQYLAGKMEVKKMVEELSQKAQMLFNENK